MMHISREINWFTETLWSKFGVKVTAESIALEGIELGLDEVEDFFVPVELFDELPETLLYEILVADDEEGNEWVGGIAFHDNLQVQNWCLQIITKNGQLVYRNLLPLLQ